MDIAAVAAIISAGVGVVTLGGIVFQTGRVTQKIDQVDATSTRTANAIARLETKLNGHVQESGEHHAVVGERLARVEALQEG